MGLPFKTVSRLKLVWNAAARLVTRDHVLKSSHRLPVSYNAQLKVLVLAYKALNGMGPKYLKERLPPCQMYWLLQLVNDAFLVVVLLVAARLALTSDRDLLVVVPSEVCLPPSLCSGEI